MVRVPNDEAQDQFAVQEKNRTDRKNLVASQTKNQVVVHAQRVHAIVQEVSPARRVNAVVHGTAKVVVHGVVDDQM